MVFNFCIVGCGRIATLNVLGYKDHPNARIYAVCDTNPERASALAKEVGAEKIYTKYDDVLTDIPEVPMETLILGADMENVAPMPIRGWVKNFEITGEGKYIKQTGGHGQYGHAIIQIEPQDRGTGYEFVNAITGGRVPREFIEPTNKGIQEAMARGFLAGFPMVDVKVTMEDGSYHEVDSSELAFKMAGSWAMRDATSKAGMVLIEPVMKVEVSTPEEFMGDVIGDLGSRRAQIQGSTNRGSVVIITALVPLSQMQGYVTILRGMTQGRATSVMLPSHYQEVPASITAKIIEERGDFRARNRGD